MLKPLSGKSGLPQGISALALMWLSWFFLSFVLVFSNCLSYLILAAVKSYPSGIVLLQRHHLPGL